MTKSSPSVSQYVVKSVKFTAKILSVFVAFLENMNIIKTNAAKTVEDLTSLEFPPDRLVNTISWANKKPFFWVNWLQFVANILFLVWGLHKINIDAQTKVGWIQPNISIFSQF